MLTQIITSITTVLILFLLHEAQSCGGTHDIETVYGGYDYKHEIKNYFYAMDSTTQDLVVAGNLVLYDGS